MSLAVCLAVLGLAATPRSKPPNVVLITVDTLRPDALGWVAGRNPTPHLDALAAEGFRFPGAVSPVPLTLPAHTSLLTGLLPRHHGARDNGHVVAAPLRTVAEALSDDGYRTAAFVSGYPLRSLFGLDQGFGLYDDALPVGPEGFRERPAGKTVDVALSWMRATPAPWFAWVHFYEPHDPYTPPAEQRRPGPRGAYDGEVAVVDSAVGRLREGLRGLPGPLLTIFTSDHGESLGEHGEPGHGLFVYDATILVPLVFHFPGRVPPGQSPAAARLIDVAPTLLELVGGSRLPDPDGVSLTPTLAGRPQEARPAYVETLQPWIAYGWSPLKALRHRGFKLIEAPRRELYDLTTDTRETASITQGHGEKLAELGALMARIEARPEAASVPVADTEVLERLRALGYVGAGRPAAPVPAGVPDPKDRVADHRILAEAESRLQAGDYERALRLLDAVLERDPHNRFALLRSGLAFLRRGEAASALPRLEKAVTLDAEQAESRFALADALMRVGRPRDAVPHWMETVRLQPRRAAAWSNLGSGLGQTGRMGEAVNAFSRAVELEPDNAAMRINLGYAQRAVGDEAAAVVSWRRAAGDKGATAFAAAASLGLGLAHLGRAQEATPWLEGARPGQADYAEARFELAAIHARAGRLPEARRALREALAADPGLEPRAALHPDLGRLRGP